MCGLFFAIYENDLQNFDEQKTVGFIRHGPEVAVLVHQFV
jgi:hypothetical protein